MNQQTKVNVEIQAWIKTCKDSRYGGKKIYYKNREYSRSEAIGRSERLLGRTLGESINLTYENYRIDDIRYDSKDSQLSRIIKP